MDYRALFREIMYYGDFDHMPVIHWKGWPETRERWIAEGMPADINEHEYFGTVPFWYGLTLSPHHFGTTNLFPCFETTTIEETNEYSIFRQYDGVICKGWKGRSSIPHYIDFTLKTAKDWPEYKKRLQPDPKRIPNDLDKRIADAENSGLPIIVHTGSLMGWIRNWMGVENMTYLMCMEPDCYADMADTLADLACWEIDQIVPRMKTKPDMGFGWEDICSKSGPFVSPAIFDQYIAPGYRKIRSKLESYGIDLFGVDSDGKVEPLIPNWLDSGVNVMFPLEPGTWKATPSVIRKKFGKELRIVGGFDKFVLEKDKNAIDNEIKRHRDIMKEGGFILMPDHLITPDVSLANYIYYLNRIRELRLH